jgi:hypothetical protein
MLLLPPRSIPQLAGRIRDAYLRRCPLLDREYAHSTVWSAAAKRLVALHRADSGLPLDPELYVAAQEGPGIGLDPWNELARPEAARCYRRLVDRIVRSLRTELRAEVRTAEHKFRSGEPLGELLASHSPRFSALGRYAVAYRAGRPDLAELFIPAARAQHRACPLYRRACRGLIPDDAYPVFDLVAEWPVLTAETAVTAPWSLN